MKNVLKSHWFIKLVSIILAFVVVQVLISLNIIDYYLQDIMATVCINIILAVSLNLITGFTGQFSLGHAGFMSIGAYSCALITLRGPELFGFIGDALSKVLPAGAATALSDNIVFIIGVVAGAVAAAIIGFLVGLPTLRLRGDYLAIATLGMSEIIRIIFLNLDITNGAAGLQNIPQFVNWPWLYFFTIGTVLVISNLLSSSHGRACISIREDEIAAESMGINTTKYKVAAFTIGAFFAGIAGALYASYFYFIKPDLFGFLKSVDILVIVVLGGMGSLPGSILASILLAVISTYLQSFPELRMVLYSLMLIIIMIFRPQGLMGSKKVSYAAFRRLAKVLPHKKGRV